MTHAPSTYNAPATAFGPRIRKSPFFEATQRYGCKAYSVYNHMYLPLYYDDPVADYWNLINHVTVWDVACQRQVEITGPDASRFVQYLTPRNLSRLSVGQCKYVFVTNEAGGVINDPILLRLGKNQFWLSLADGDILLWAQGVALHSMMNVQIYEPDVSPLQVQGPKSLETMQALVGNWVSELRYYWFQEAKIGHIPVIVSRTGWSSERGYEIFLRDSRFGDELWERVMEAGKEFEIAPGAPSAIRRIEGSMLSYGADMYMVENPFELGLERLVDLDQDADFIGKDALRVIKSKGVSRHICGLEIHARPISLNEQPWPVRADDQPIGHVTSAVHSPRLQKNIALAMLATDYTTLGTKVTVEAPSDNLDAAVVPVPFYDPKKALATSI